MKFNKTNSSDQVGWVSGQYVPGDSSNESGDLTTRGTSYEGLDRTVWGAPDDGGDVDGHLVCNGNMVIASGDGYDAETDTDDEDRYTDEPEDEDAEDTYDDTNHAYEEYKDKFDSDEGNLYVEKKIYAGKEVKSPEVYGNKLFLDYGGQNRVNLADLLMNAVLPIGSIIAFNGNSTIPAAWAICDGGLHDGVRTPDLRGRFVIGGEMADLGDFGGARSYKLNANHLPEHTHSYNGISFTSTVEVPSGVGATDTVNVVGNITRASTASGTNSTTNENYNVMPPYYTLVYIMKIK